MLPGGCRGAAKSTSPQARPKKVRDRKLNKIPQHADCALLFVAVLIKRKKPANSQRYLAWAGANVRCGACHRRPKVRPWIPIYSPLSPLSRHSRTPNSTRWPMPHTRHRGSQRGLLAWIEGALEQPLQSAELDRPKLAGQRPSSLTASGLIVDGRSSARTRLPGCSEPVIETDGSGRRSRPPASLTSPRLDLQRQRRH